MKNKHNAFQGAKSLWYRLLLATFWLLATSYTSVSMAVTVDKTAANGKVRIHYPASSQSRCDAIMIGVGTSMGADAYDKLSARLIEQGYVAVIMDHNPGNMVKTSATKYQALAEEVKLKLLGWIGQTSCGGIAHWVMGGHSAGGQAAHNAIANNPGLADATFSIDPYDISSAGRVNVPALYWGFDVTTCFVEKDKAAKAAYYKSDSQRAFYKVKKLYSWGPCGYSPKYFHCSFCDNHCPACTNCMTTPDHFFVDVAKSVKKFVNVAFYGNWSKSALTITSTTPLTLYVDGDQP